MIKLAIALTLVVGGVTAAAARSGGLYGTGSNPSAHTVRPYFTPKGTYVQPHLQTNRNRTQLDNFNTRGNVNPYTGQPGTRIPRF
jgi:hypothetical protein